MRHATAAVLLAGALIFLPGAARSSSDKVPTGVEGVAAFRGDFVEGARIMAFKDAGPDDRARPVAESEPTDGDGRYRLLLPPGRYYLIAFKGGSPSWPLALQPGDLYCYYLGNPVPVLPDRMTRVGFNMVRVPREEEPRSGGGTVVTGQVLFEDNPLGRSYVYLYRDGDSNFRGMGVAALPTDEKGEFRLKVAPGSYYLLARKRKAGGMYGPPQKDDHIGYYHGNPVTVREGESRRVILEMTTRIDLLEEVWFKDGKGAGWFRGKVLDGDGRPVPGLYVLFYPGSDTGGTPAFMAGPTTEDGAFRVRSAPGSYRVIARSSIGGPPSAGEWYGTYRSKSGEEQVEGPMEEEIRVVVGRQKSP